MLSISRFIFKTLYLFSNFCRFNYLVINNPSIFTPASIYRIEDTNFGVQTDLSLVVYAGIETTEAPAYISAMGLNHKTKRFQFGAIKKAVAITPGTNNQIYEIVYVEMIDPLEANGKRLPSSITRLEPQKQTIFADNANSLTKPIFCPSGVAFGHTKKI